MTTNEVIALFMTLIGGLLIGLAAYWLAAHEDKEPRAHGRPGE